MSRVASGYMTECRLGSNGHLYDGALPDGIVPCSPWGTGEEMLLNSPINQHILLDRLIKACCELPIPPEQLTIQDRFQLFFHQRNISYPRPYTYKFRCEDCGNPSRSKVDLKTLQTVYLGDASEDQPKGHIRFAGEPVETRLALMGSTVGWRFLRGSDEKKIQNYANRERSAHPDLKGDAGYVYRIAIRVMTIDGQACNLADAMTLVRELKGEDSLALRDSFDEYTYGIVPKISPECQTCGWVNGPFTLPYDQSFFRPARDGGDTPPIDSGDPVEPSVPS